VRVVICVVGAADRSEEDETERGGGCCVCGSIKIMCG